MSTNSRMMVTSLKVMKRLLQDLASEYPGSVSVHRQARLDAAIEDPDLVRTDNQTRLDVLSFYTGGDWAYLKIPTDIRFELFQAMKPKRPPGAVVYFQNRGAAEALARKYEDILIHPIMSSGVMERSLNFLEEAAEKMIIRPEWKKLVKVWREFIRRSDRVATKQRGPYKNIGISFHNMHHGLSGAVRGLPHAKRLLWTKPDQYLRSLIHEFCHITEIEDLIAFFPDLVWPTLDLTSEPVDILKS